MLSDPCLFREIRVPSNIAIMQTLKIIGAGVFALFAIGSLFSFLGRLPNILSAISSSSAASGSTNSSYAFGQIAGGIIFTLLMGAIAWKLWKSATAPRVRNEQIGAPLPEVPRKEN